MATSNIDIRRIRATAVRHWKYLLAFAILVAILIGLAVRNGSNGAEIPEESLRAVTLMNVGGNGAGIAVPTADGSSYIIRAEAGGRITRIAATGKEITAGEIVAELDSSAQRAALTQAEGVYEAALAASGGQNTTQESARRDGVRAWSDATVSASETVRTIVDDYFGEVRGTQGTSGFRLEAFGEAATLNAARSNLEDTFDRWESESVNPDNADQRLLSLASDLMAIANLIDRIAALVPRQSNTSVYTEAERAADATALSGARATISALQDSVDVAETAIRSSSGTGDASAQAQVKQALGALEAARASYAKTLVRSPIAGILISRSVAVGDIITSGADIAIIRGAPGERSASYALPLTAVKYTPAGAFVFIVRDGVLEAISIETGLVTVASIETSGLSGDEMIVRDVRGLKAGQRVTVE